MANVEIPTAADVMAAVEAYRIDGGDDARRDVLELVNVLRLAYDAAYYVSQAEQVYRNSPGSV